MSSPNPGVSTIVKAMRTPSSSSSAMPVPQHRRVDVCSMVVALTDVHRLDSDSSFCVGVLGGIEDFVNENLRLAEGVNEGSFAGSRGAFE